MLKYTNYISLGTDPELFLAKNGAVIGSEKAVPKEGLAHGQVVLDGVQLELHPIPAQTVAGLCGNLGLAFSGLKSHLTTHAVGTQPCFTQTVFVDPSELASLSKEARILGCAPSENFYGIKRLEAKEGETQRSAGGHVHLGLTSPLHLERISLVPIHDALTANTSVMLDRDPHAALRRTMYGRPGEYRLPRYGIEYRTLSNWWLKSRATAEFVFGMSQLACDILSTTLAAKEGDETPEQDLFDKLDLDKVVKAVMDNDAILAYENWKVVREFISKWIQPDDRYPLHSGNISRFDRLISKVAKEGSLDSMMPVDPVDHWTQIHYQEGWHAFLGRVTS